MIELHCLGYIIHFSFSYKKYLKKIFLSLPLLFVSEDDNGGMMMMMEWNYSNHHIYHSKLFLFFITHYGLGNISSMK